MEFFLKIKNYYKTNTSSFFEIVLMVLLSVFFLFTRIYQLVDRMSWGYDQVQAAWASKYILIDHKFLLLGPVAKAAGGFSVGPFYYDLISIFYFFTHMNPIASPIFATFAAFITFIVLFFTIKNIFNFWIAFIAVFIETIAYVSMDRTEWNASFIVFCSAIIFYLLYKLLTDKTKNYYIIWLGVALGFAFSIHFTSVFYPILIILLLPFVKWNKKIAIYSLIGVVITLICLSPVIYFDLTSKNSESHGIFSYLGTYYHGFHLKRVLQLTHDAFIEFLIIFRTKLADYFDFLLPVIFIFIYLYKKLSRERIILCYMVGIWFILPWFAFATYSGELTNYYLWITRPVVLIVLSYLFYKIFNLKTFIPKIAVFALLLLLAYLNLSDFFISTPNYELKRAQTDVNLDILNNRPLNYNLHAPQSYTYYYYHVYAEKH